MMDSVLGEIFDVCVRVDRKPRVFLMGDIPNGLALTQEDVGELTARLIVAGQLVDYMEQKHDYAVRSSEDS